MIFDYRTQKRRDRLRHGTLRHSFDRCTTNSPTLVTQRAEQDRRVVRLVVTKRLSRIQSCRFIGFGQTRREFALTFESFGDVLDSHDQSRDRRVVTQWRDHDALLHFVEMPGGRYRSTGNQVMMEGRCEHFHYAVLQRSLEAVQQATLLEVGEQCGQSLTQSRLLANAGEPRERGIPNSNDELTVCCENAD